MRINYVNLILGRRGSGKTTFVKELIENYKKNRPEMKILIVDTFNNPGYLHIPLIDFKFLKAWKNPSIYKIYSSDTDLMLSEIQTNCLNTLIIFEDAVKYINRPIQKDVRKFIIDSKQKNLDLIFLFHGFASAPPELFRLSDSVTLFRCDDPTYRKNELIEFDLIYKAWLDVYKSKNKYEKKTIRLQ